MRRALAGQPAQQAGLGRGLQPLAPPRRAAAALALATAPRAADAAKPGAFAFRDLDDPTKPTRIVQPDAGAAARDADADEETQRSWTRKPAYWDIHARKRLRDADSS